MGIDGRMAGRIADRRIGDRKAEAVIAAAHIERAAADADFGGLVGIDIDLACRRRRRAGKRRIRDVGGGAVADDAGRAGQSEGIGVRTTRQPDRDGSLKTAAHRLHDNGLVIVDGGIVDIGLGGVAGNQERKRPRDRRATGRRLRAEIERGSTGGDVGGGIVDRLHHRRRRRAGRGVAIDAGAVDVRIGVERNDGNRGTAGDIDAKPRGGRRVRLLHGVGDSLDNVLRWIVVNEGVDRLQFAGEAARCRAGIRFDRGDRCCRQPPRRRRGYVQPIGVNRAG